MSFGFHPDLTLPGVARADWHIEEPVRGRARLDARAFDDLFPTLDRPAHLLRRGVTDPVECGA